MQHAIDRPWRAKELADRLGISERTVWRWIAAKELKSVRVGGMRFIPQHEVARLLGVREHVEVPRQ